MAEDARVCSPSGAPGGWCAREAADCAARCALEVEYAAEGSHLEAGDSSAFSFNASLTVVNNEAASLRAWQATWAFAEGEGVARDAAFATDVAVLVSPGGPGGQPARLVNALGEGGAVPPAGRRTFAFKGVASGVSTAPRSVARVHLNGARCVAIQEPPSSRVELEEPDERSSFASGHDDDVHDDVDANEPQTGVSFASCPKDAVSFFRFCCGETKTSLDASDASSQSSKQSVSVFANASSVVVSALVVVASGIVLALLARLARAVARRFKEKGAFFSARRKTTAFLPGQVASAPAADLDGIVVRSSGNGNGVGRDGREPARASRSARRYDPSAASSREDASLDEFEDGRRFRDSNDSGLDAADGADALVVVALSEIELGDVLGRGAYGVVRRGVWRRKSPSGRESEVDRDDAADAADAADASDDAEDGLPDADGKKRPWTSTRVAVKTLRAARLGTRPSRGALRAFKREVAVLSRLRHPCVVRLLGACLTPPDLCIVEELVEGGSLHAYLHGPGARRGDAGPPSGDASETRPATLTKTLPSVSSALDVCFDVARAMAYLAARGVTHRDLKSQNVLLVFPDRFRETNEPYDCELTGRRLRAKVADFGIAKSRTLDAAADANAFLATNGTTGVITGGGAAGTPAWMAPELFRDAPFADQASDAYSFGVVLWECLTGKTPWGWLRDPIQIVFAVAVEGKRLPFPPRVFRDEGGGAEAEDGFRHSASAEETTRALLERCWAEDPRDRPGFEEIGKVLRGLRASADESRGSEARAEP
jgi:serine/threonine protein kinase